MHTVSTVVITYNEEAVLNRCLASLEGVADEIIVVDSFSTDTTEQIAAQYGVRWIRHAFEGYIEQKNLAAGQAGMDYILSLDADECLSADLRAWLISQKKSGFSAQAYYFNRLNYYCGKPIRHGSYYPDRKLRLWKNGVGAWGGENPHDRYEVPDGTLTKRVALDICHYSFDSVDAHRRQMERFSTLAAKAMFSRGKKVSPLRPAISAGWTFFKEFFLEAGWMDGYYGWVIARMNTLYTFWKYQKLRALREIPAD